ncbi:MAG TPA: histidine ammonia-lyase [Longilinea sp.]|nr:histidine ammonia-lyase [Longilinea sp.]
MIEIEGNHLTIEACKKVGREHDHVALSRAGKETIQASQDRLKKILSEDKPVYGINTGFGIFAEKRILAAESSQLSRNLILSHAVGTGAPLASDVVRAAMLVRANTLTKGFSGVREVVVQTLLDMLNKGVTPVVPSQGSLGSSGDLGPLSHMALVLTRGEPDQESDSGLAEYDEQVLSGKAAMEQAGIERILLGPKEGLALNNGATFSAAIASLVVWDSQRLLDLAEASLALSLEALLGCSQAFDPRIHMARNHPGQQIVAASVLKYLEGSTLIDSTPRVQDAYSLRCAPQVHGAARDTLGHTAEVTETEINSATDNPLIFDPGTALSGGNFHGEPIGLVMDFLGIAMAEIGAISERRIFRLIDNKLNGGLPPMLVDKPKAAGLNSGLMMPQYTAASLVLENQTLATPDTVHSLPTSGEQEDHNANAMTAARHAQQIVDNVAHIIAIEFYTAARALDLRLRQNDGYKMGKGTRHVYDQIRAVVPYQPGDAWWGPEIDKARALLTQMELP